MSTTLNRIVNTRKQFIDALKQQKEFTEEADTIELPFKEEIPKILENGHIHRFRNGYFMIYQEENDSKESSMYDKFVCINHDPNIYNAIEQCKAYLARHRETQVFYPGHRHTYPCHKWHMLFSATDFDKVLKNFPNTYKNFCINIYREMLSAHEDALDSALINEPRSEFSDLIIPFTSPPYNEYFSKNLHNYYKTPYHKEQEIKFGPHLENKVAEEFSINLNQPIEKIYLEKNNCSKTLMKIMSAYVLSGRIDKATELALNHVDKRFLIPKLFDAGSHVLVKEEGNEVIKNINNRNIVSNNNTHSRDNNMFKKLQSLCKINSLKF